MNSIRALIAALMLVATTAHASATGCTRMLSVSDHIESQERIAGVGSAECYMHAQHVIFASYRSYTYIESVLSPASLGPQLTYKDSLLVLFNYKNGRCSYYRLARVGPVTKIYPRSIPSCGVAKLVQDKSKLVIVVPALPNKELDFTSNVRFNLTTMEWE